jgi:phosphatidylglycerophosphate synthase
MVLVGSDDPVVWGLGTAERHRRVCRRLGISEETGGAAASGDAPVLLLRRDFVLDENLVRALAGSPGTVVVAPDAGGAPCPVAANVLASAAPAVAAMIERGGDPADDPAARAHPGLRLAGPEEVGPAFNRTLRKRARPFALHATPATRRQVEWRTFTEAYKGATDFVTKFAWPVPAFHVTRWCAARGLSPNMVTSASAVLMLLATWLFWDGHLALGLLPAWAMTFLDTVDGKLARCTLTSSRWGDVFDHGIDLLHPPFWWIAWWHGARQVDGGSVAEGPLWAALAIVFVGYVVLRLLELAFKALFGIQTHIWRPVDYWFRAITSRRNPNLAILTLATLLGSPASGLVAVAAWTVLSILFHLVRIGQAARVRAAGGRIESWLNQPAAAIAPPGAAGPATGGA